MSWEELLDQRLVEEAANSILTKTDKSKTDYFHIGQCYAYGNENFKDLAVKYLLKSYKENDNWDSYVDATIAFVESDVTSLKVAMRKVSNSQQRMVVNRLLKGLLLKKSYKEIYDSL
jgi:hypothetical protein